MIVRWGLEELSDLLGELGIDSPFLIASERWSALDLPAEGRWSEVPSERIDEIAAATRGSNGLLAVGGGSAIDLGKAVSSVTGLGLVSVPTTYSGSEWTQFFGIRDPRRRMVGGGGGARLAGIVYEPKLTLNLPRAESGGTALNALAHCAEALYVAGRNPQGDEQALEGARLIGDSLPQVLEHGDDLDSRTTLLRGAMHAGEALASAGLGLGHAMAQALGGRYGIRARRGERALPAAGAALQRAGRGRRDRALRRGAARRGRRGSLRGALTPSRLRAAARPRRAGRRARPGRRGHCGSRRAHSRIRGPRAPAEIAELFRSIW